MLMKTTSSISSTSRQPLVGARQYVTRKLMYIILSFLGFHIYFLSIEYADDHAQLRRFATETMDTIIEEDPSSLLPTTSEINSETVDSSMSIESSNQDTDRKMYSFSNELERIQEDAVDADDTVKVIERMRKKNKESLNRKMRSFSNEVDLMQEDDVNSSMSLGPSDQDTDRKTYSFSHDVDQMQEDDANGKEKVIQSMKIRRTKEEKKMDIPHKPKMYTFLISNDGDNGMLELWQEEWTGAGFDTQLLTLDDAKLHPRFTEFEEKLQSVLMNSPTKIYDEMRYFRHLAMASVGGGYMSEYEVLPLTDRPVTEGEGNEDKEDDVYFTSNKLPIDFSNDEVITSYNSFVPSLMSGSALAWENFAFQLLENALQHSHETLWVDMFAMLDVKMVNQDAYKSTDVVLSSFPLQEEWTEDLCANTRRYIAAHFSHQVFKAAKVELEQRPRFAKKWLNDWRSSCNHETATTSI